MLLLLLLLLQEEPTIGLGQHCARQLHLGV